ncbi:distal tail protein Dit [Paenibacillus oryzisoli]|uniref:Phage tail protein n=1 Tax=Paenibacillus oryzisoli TaxID=1850517 RepID=A0A198AIR8_9BACL|nr:distal tail protein Dit [Paenibacillus oryzisoli]OAS21132.1 hypothetical protein A8708_30035 [Paenibacillus oryzisoli]
MSINGGFTLGGQTARQLGIRMLRTSQRPVLPDTVDRTLGIPGRNGLWDFGADLNARQFNLECVILRTNSTTLQQQVSTLAAFLLDQYAKPRTLELVFDNQPDRTYYVRYSGSLAIDRVVGRGQFTLPLVAFDLYAYADLDFMDEEYLYDTDLDYDSGLYYPNSRMVQDYSFVSPGMVVIVGEERKWSGFVWAYPEQYSTLMNYSAMFTPMIMRISGTVTNPTITNVVNGQSMTIATTITNQTLVIDCTKYTVKIDGVNALEYVTGDILGLAPGENQFLFTGTNPNASITYQWRHKFI